MADSEHWVVAFCRNVVVLPGKTGNRRLKWPPLTAPLPASFGILEIVHVGIPPGLSSMIPKKFPIKIGLPELLMGVETPIPPKKINAAAPKGRPRGGSRRLE